MNSAQRWWLLHTEEGRELLDGIEPDRRTRLLAACCEYSGLPPGGLLEHVDGVERMLDEQARRRRRP